jgi:hypothetical protein
MEQYSLTKLQLLNREVKFSVRVGALSILSLLSHFKAPKSTALYYRSDCPCRLGAHAPMI